MNPFPCLGHEPIIPKIEPADTYEIPSGIKQRIFDEFDAYLDTLPNEKIFDCLSRPRSSIRYPGLSSRLDNETDNNSAAFYSLQLQRNNNSKLFSNIKSSFCHVMVDSQLSYLPLQKEAKKIEPCPHCRDRIVNEFKKALESSFFYSIHSNFNESKRLVGRTFILTKSTAPPSNIMTYADDTNDYSYDYFG